MYIGPGSKRVWHFSGGGDLPHGQWKNLAMAVVHKYKECGHPVLKGDCKFRQEELNDAGKSTQFNSSDTSKEAVMNLSGAASDLCVLHRVCQHLSGAITETLQGPHSAAHVTVSLQSSLPHPSPRAISVDPEARRDPEPVEDSVLLLSCSAEEAHVLQSTTEGNFEKKGTASFFTRKVAQGDLEQIHFTKTNANSCQKNLQNKQKEIVRSCNIAYCSLPLAVGQCLQTRPARNS